MSIAQLVQKATNERLTSEDWQAIIAVCDHVNGASSADISAGFQALYKRLESSTGNAQMYALTLINAMAQNGNTRVKTAIASAETRKVLAGVLRSNHKTVRERARDIIKDLAEALQDGEFSKWAESAAGKRSQESHNDQTGPDEEAQIREAIRLSMQDQAPPQAAPHTVRAETPTDSNSEVLASVHRSPNGSANHDGNPNGNPNGNHGNVQTCKTLYAYSSQTAGDLNFRAGETIQVLDSSHKDWWRGSLNGVVGVFPSNYVELTRDEVIATEEDYVFAQAPNVERLLSIFASASQQPGYSIVGNPDLQAMYDEVMALRPQLIRMIDEYGARKQKLMGLNSDIVETRRRYEQLVNTRGLGSHVGGHQFEARGGGGHQARPQHSETDRAQALHMAPAPGASLPAAAVVPGEACGYAHASHTPSAPHYHNPDPDLTPSAPPPLSPAGLSTDFAPSRAPGTTASPEPTPEDHRVPARLPYPL